MIDADVLDTSVLVAAARSRRGASSDLLNMMPTSKFTPVCSVPLFVEYRSVLLRPENLLTRTADQAERFLDALLQMSLLQEVFYSWRPALPDADDDMILEVAVAGSARYIVTHNLRDLSGAEEWGISAVPPGDYLRLMR